MTLDSSRTSSTVLENSDYTNRASEDTLMTDAGTTPGSGIETMPSPHDTVDTPSGCCGQPWGYIMIHNSQVELFKSQVAAYNLAHPGQTHECFVHYSYRYKPKESGRGVARKLQPTVSGLVFLQGHTAELQSFLRENHPQYHLVNDCSTKRPACISDHVMRPFMSAVTAYPERVTFLREPFVKFAKDHTRLRILTGLFSGLEGYIVRIDRDRQLVMEFGGYAVALRGIHQEDFEVAE